jgi:methylase of polypeptide subunit release factors
VVYNLYIRRKINRKVTESLGGFKFTVYPSVFNPTDYISSELFVEFIKKLGSLTGKRILDMGSGSGVVSMFAATGGADCTAVDINPMAIRSINENANVNGLSEKITAIESDLFENPLLNVFAAEKEKENKSGSYIFFNPFGSRPALKHFELGKLGEEIKDQLKNQQLKGEQTVKSIEKPEGIVSPGFDIIFFNPPYYKGEPKDNFERAFKGGVKLEVITRFLSQAKNYLKPGGVIYFIVSSDMDMDELQEMFTHAGYRYLIIKEIKKFFETFYIIESVV